MKPPRATLAPPALVFALVAVIAPAVPGHGQPRCDSSTALTLVGVDSAAGHALFALPRGGAEGWLIAADLTAGAAAAWPEPMAAKRRGSSSGPGAPLLTLTCGDRCLQPVTFRDGEWSALGEPVLAPAAATVHGTWDRAGNAWLVLHLGRAEAGVQALGYRLDGKDWRQEGSLVVRGVGSPGAYPAPPGEPGVVSGDGHFVAGAKPRRWLAARPAEGGDLLWLGGARAVQLGADGVLRWTTDGGTRWELLRWLPWASGEGDLAWRPGREHWIELPEGERRPPLLAVWNDQRVPTRARLVVAEESGPGSWRRLVELPQGLATSQGERLAFNHLLRFEDRLVAISGCVARADGFALALRALKGATLADPQVIPVRVGGR